MKKILTLTLVLILVLSMLTACGGGNNGANDTPSNTPSNSDNSSTTPASDDDQPTNVQAEAPATPVVEPIFVRREAEVPDKIISLADDSIFYIVIDGVKYSMPDTTVQDFLDNGFTFRAKDEDAQRSIEAGGRAALETVLITKGTTNQHINISAKNLTDHSLPLKDCTVTFIWIGRGLWSFGENSSDLDASIICNLGLGSTEEDVVSVFGDGYRKLMSDQRLEYGRGSGKEYKGFTFIKDESSNIIGIYASVGGL